MLRARSGSAQDFMKRCPWFPEHSLSSAATIRLEFLIQPARRFTTAVPCTSGIRDWKDGDQQQFNVSFI